MDALLSTLMRRSSQGGGATLLAAVALVACAASRPTEPAATETEKQQIRSEYGKLPLSFEANHGQTDRQVKFLSRGHGYSLFLTPSEAVLRVQKAASPSEKAAQSVVRMKLVGGNPQAASRGVEPRPGRLNYLLGSDPSKWQRNVPLYGRVAFESVYPGIDLVYYGNQGKLEYDFVVEPGADFSPIRLAFEGARRVETDAAGNLLLHTEAGEVRQRKPVVFQEIDGRRIPIEGKYICLNEREVKFAVGAYDRSAELVIDPILEYSSYLGGADSDEAFGVAVDASRNAYVIGTSASALFPSTTGAFDTVTDASGDAFVTKLDASGSNIVYSTFIGGNSFDIGKAIVVDNAGQAHITGQTLSTNFPAVNAVQATKNTGSDAFIAQLSADGGNVNFSTFLGGTGPEIGVGIGIDGTGAIYVGGVTKSTDLVTTAGAVDTTYNGVDDLFLTKLPSNGSAFTYLTYLGGADRDEVHGLAVDASGHVFLTGLTLSNDFPTASPLQASLGGSQDAFITKVHPTGQSLIYSTYLGGRFGEAGYDIALDATGAAYVVGEVGSDDFPTTGLAYDQSRSGATDAFLTKLNALGSSLVYSTYLGGNLFDSGRSVDVDSVGNAWVTGNTSSSSFPTRNPEQAVLLGTSDCFVTKFNTNGSSISYSTYLGGSGAELGHAVDVDDNGDAYVAGATVSANWPTVNPVFGPGIYEGDVFHGGAKDAFICKISDPPAPPTAPFALTATAAGIAQINLVWKDASNNEDVFEIERRTGSDPNFTPLATTEPSIATYVDTAVVSNTQYTYRVRASNQFGTSLYTNTATARTFPDPPADPGGLTISVISQNDLLLFWTDNSVSETDYEVERKSADGTFSKIATLAEDSTTFVDSNLTANTPYTYRVRAVNDDGPSNYTNEATGSTLPNRPGTPTTLKANVSSSTQVVLSWTDNADNETGFKIERRLGTVGRFTQIALVGENAVSFTDDTVSAATTYSYRIRANNVGGDSAYSNDVEATTPPNPPGAPANLQGTMISRTQINLAWTDTSLNETGFVVERRLSGGTYAPLVELGQNVTTYSDTTVVANATYNYRVAAKNIGGNSPYSNEAIVSTPPDPPAAPGNLAATVVSQSQINLVWTDGSVNEIGFIVERSVGGGSFIELAFVDADETTFSDTGLSAETTYSYRVKADGLGGSSAYSNTVVATTTPAPPTAPTDLRIVAATATFVHLAWLDASDNEAGFTLERRTTQSQFAVVATLAAGVTEYFDNSVAEQTTYVYRLRAFNAGGTSAYTNLANGRTSPAVPTAPSGLTASILSSTSVRLNWNDNSLTESRFKIERKVGEGIFVALAEVSAGVTSYTDTGVASDVNYTYRVKASNGGGDSAATNEAAVLIPSGGRIKVTPVRLNLGQVRIGRTKAAKFKITNTGPGTLAVTVGTLSAPFRIVSGGGSFILPARQTRIVTVEFEPTATGTASAALTVSSSDARKGTTTVIVSGRGRP